MCLDRRTGGAGSRRCRAVLMAGCWIQQLIAGDAVLEHHLAVIEHAPAQQIIHRAHHVQHDDVVAGLDDGKVETGVQLGLIGGVALLMGMASILANSVATT